MVIKIKTIRFPTYYYNSLTISSPPNSIGSSPFSSIVAFPFRLDFLLSLLFPYVFLQRFAAHIVFNATYYFLLHRITLTSSGTHKNSIVQNNSNISRIHRRRGVRRYHKLEPATTGAEIKDPRKRSKENRKRQKKKNDR